MLSSGLAVFPTSVTKDRSQDPGSFLDLTIGAQTWPWEDSSQIAGLCSLSQSRRAGGLGA